jgi:hypothetical protein
MPAPIATLANAIMLCCTGVSGRNGCSISIVSVIFNPLIFNVWCSFDAASDMLRKGWGILFGFALTPYRASEAKRVPRCATAVAFFAKINPLD